MALRQFGMRSSETLSLRWADVDWANSRVRVRSPKTEHIEGKESRMIPLFPELRPFLQEAWEQAAPKAEFVVMSYRSIKQNLGTQFKRIIERAGLEPWPKLFQNLRSTRETELMESFPAHVVCAWIGNSEAVARKHYLQVTDDHFAKASGQAVKPVQNTVQQSAETTRIEPQPAKSAHEKTPGFPGFSASCDLVHECIVPLRGFEPRLTD
ncbi:MAG: site-specific integrase [Planctomycetia bacterium]|nr:site-specific integrase [Planctomycetia bacterium]